MIYKAFTLFEGDTIESKKFVIQKRSPEDTPTTSNLAMDLREKTTFYRKATVSALFLLQPSCTLTSTRAPNPLSDVTPTALDPR